MVALILYHCSSSKCFFATHACKLLATLLLINLLLMQNRKKKKQETDRQNRQYCKIKSAKPGNHAWVHVGYFLTKT